MVVKTTRPATAGGEKEARKIREVVDARAVYLLLVKR